jgi:hypothetical protein
MSSLIVPNIFILPDKYCYMAGCQQVFWIPIIILCLFIMTAVRFVFFLHYVNVILPLFPHGMPRQGWHFGSSSPFEKNKHIKSHSYACKICP